jgi:hypothetical protein
MGPFGEEVINDNGDKLIDIREQMLFKILNGYFQHKKIHQYAWHQDTSVHMAPRYTGAKVHNRLHYCQTKFWVKISRCKNI